MHRILRRTLPIATILPLTWGCSAAPLTDAERQAVVDEVTDVMAELNDAMNAHEPERVVAFYSDDPGFLALTCTGFISGGSTFKAMTGPTYGPKRGRTFQQQVVRVQVLSATAAVVSQRGSSSTAPWLFWTRVLSKDSGRWIITYEHQSWPGCSPPVDPHPTTTPSDSAALLPGGISN